MIPGSLDVSPKPGKVCVEAKEYHGRRSKRKKIGEQPLPVDAASAPCLNLGDAPTRAAVAPIQSGTPGGSISPSPAANGRLTADSAGARQSAHRGGGSGHRVLGPLARPITRMQPPQASASELALARAADPPPRYAAKREQVTHGE